MEFSTATPADGVAVIACRGRLNMVAAPRLTALLSDVIEGGDARVVIDLGETSFMDSSGLGALVGGLKKARQAGGNLRIAAPGDQVRMVLSLTNLDQVLHTFDTVEDAADDW